VHDLSWSSDSELLAVVLGPVPGLEATTAEDEQPWAVQVKECPPRGGGGGNMQMQHA
jgi:hypothetical protein